MLVLKSLNQTGKNRHTLNRWAFWFACRSLNKRKPKKMHFNQTLFVSSRNVTAFSKNSTFHAVKKTFHLVFRPKICFLLLRSRLQDISALHLHLNDLMMFHVLNRSIIQMCVHSASVTSSDCLINSVCVTSSTL